MIDRLMPLFAIIGVLSSLGYLSLMAWVMYRNLTRSKKKPLAAHRTEHA
ncbi:hypothetical protein LVJ83_11645 [Uruburuella testudinis]|uniref:DUF3149 domain-containing protein n=1 Tax=Uruburuella testudinis TaxID=1282863 RepID=A0ABY4DS81_9NEIS|nr:hypothetical protein [Uruburuella testudinis]UOO81570.1 hypothetical protein LVJ83_11645 [Uruburuella testudinis]